MSFDKAMGDLRRARESLERVKRSAYRQQDNLERAAQALKIVVVVAGAMFIASVIAGAYLLASAQ